MIPAIPEGESTTPSKSGPATIFLGLSNGFEEWRNQEIRYFGEEDGVDPTDAVRMLLRRKNGEIWLGTFGEGIYRYDGKEVQQLGVEEGLLSDSVAYLYETEDERLWIAYRWIGAGYLRDGRWVNFSHPDGLPNNPVEVIVEDPSGGVMLSTMREGAYRFHPESDPPNAEIVAGPLHIDSHGIGVFTFGGWDAWDNTPPNELFYSWRIVPESKGTRPSDWSPFETESFMVTQSLPPGNYRLEVRSSDRQGNIDPSPDTMAFTVAAPFYLSPLFWAPLFLLLLTLIGAALHRKRTHERLLDSNRSLQVSEERFRILVEQASDAFFVHDYEGQILEVNDQACESLGYTREELLNMTVQEVDPFFAPSELEEVRDRLRKYPNKATTVEGRHLRKDGSTFPVEVRIGVFTTEQGSLILALARDITERQQAEEALKQSEQLYREAIEVAGAVPYYQLYDPDSYSFVGEGIQELTSLTPDEFTNKMFADLVQETIFYGDLKGLSPPEAVERVKSETGLIWKADYRILTKDGREKWLANAAVIIRTEDGTPHGSLGIIQDISEEKFHQEEALRRLEKVGEQQTALKELATMGGGSDLDTEKVFAGVTETASKILEVSRSSIWLFDEEYRAIRCVDLYEEDSDSHTRGMVLEEEKYPNYFKALLADRVIDAVDAESDPRTEEFKSDYLVSNDIVSMLDAPIHVSGRVVGVICHEQVGQRRGWTPEEITFSGGLSDCVALTLANQERLRVQEALEFSEERFRSMIDNSSEAIFCFEYAPGVPTDLSVEEQAYKMAHQAILVDCNERYAQAYGGARAEDLIGQKYLDFTTWGDDEVIVFQKFVESGYRVVDGEIRELREDGAYRYILSSAMA